MVSTYPAFALRFVILATLVQFPVGSLAAENAKKAEKSATSKIVLTPEEKAEREGRKACKIEICKAFRVRKPGGDIACNITKSWRKEQLDKMIKKARVSWPWGRVICKADIKLKRADLIAAMTAKNYNLKLEQHRVACEVARKKDPANIKFSFSPEVKFESGVAKKAALNWGKIEAPTLIKGAMWTATATDNTFNVLENTLVEDINEFITSRCDEVKSDWQ